MYGDGDVYGDELCVYGDELCTGMGYERVRG